MWSLKSIIVGENSVFGTKYEKKLLIKTLINELFMVSLFYILQQAQF